MISIILSLLALPLGHTAPAVPTSNANSYNLLCVGDSITASVPGGGTTFCQRIANQLVTVGGKPIHVTNAGVPANKACDMLARTNALLQYGVWDAVVVLGGVNDANSGSDAASAEACLLTLYQNLVATAQSVPPQPQAAPKIVIVSILPESNFSGWNSTVQNTIDGINTQLLSGICGVGATYVGPCLASPGVPDSSGTNVLKCFDAFNLMRTGLALNASYDSGDGLHPNQTGHNYMATQICSALGLPAC